jgi:hypothetical protein
MNKVFIHWKDKSADNKKAWEHAEKWFEDRNGKQPSSGKDYGSIMAYAVNWLKKHGSATESQEKMASSLNPENGKNPIRADVVKKVLKSLREVVLSDKSSEKDTELTKNKNLGSDVDLVKGDNIPEGSVDEGTGENTTVDETTVEISSEYEDEVETESVEGDPQNQVTTRPLTANEDEPIADTNVQDSYTEVEYDFVGGGQVAVEVPIEGTDDSNVIVFNQVASGVYVFNSAYLKKSSGHYVFVKDEKDITKLLSGAEHTNKLLVDMDGRYIVLKDLRSAVMFKRSNVLSMIAVEAPFIKSIRNSKYTLFTRKNNKLVNSDGLEITSSALNRVIASSTSMKSIKQTEVKSNLFSEVERRFLWSQKKLIKTLMVQNKDLKRQLEVEKNRSKSVRSFYQGQIKDYKAKVNNRIIDMKSSLEKFSAKDKETRIQEQLERIRSNKETGSLPEGSDKEFLARLAKKL